MTREIEVPFLDMSAIHGPIFHEIETAISQVVASGSFVLGDQVRSFEAEFAAYCQTRHAVGVASGLDALSLVLEAWKCQGRLREGDGVVVPANTFIATLLAVSRAGLTPILVEPDERTFNVDLAGVIRALGEGARAVIAVHLYGRLAPMDELAEFCASRDVLLLEDAAQAHGATLKGRRAGSWGDAAAFSFYPAKNLGAFGDAGAITTNDGALAETLKSLRNYGSPIKYRHDLLGMNSRLDEIQAAILRKKLGCLDEQNALRRAIASKYQDEIRHPRIVLPSSGPPEAHVWHLYVVRTHDRSGLAGYLAANGIQTQVHYPTPPHQQACYRDVLGNRSFPISEAIHAEVLSLPIYPGLTEGQVAKVISTVNAWA